MNKIRSSYEAILQRALSGDAKQRRIDSREAKSLVEAAKERIGRAVNPNATRIKFARDLEVLSGMATTPNVKRALQDFARNDLFEAYQDRNTKLCEEACGALSALIKANPQAALPYPLSIIDPQSIQKDDTDADAFYVRAAVDGSRVKDGKDLIALGKELIKALASDPNLAHLRGTKFRLEWK